MRHFYLVLVLLTGTLTSCTTAPTDHERQSEEIRLLMQRMQRLVFERELTDQEVAAQRRTQGDQLVEIAEDAARTLRTSVDDPEMEPYILALTKRAREMRDLSSMPGKWEFSTEMDLLFDACNSCHTRFRDGGTQ